MTLCAAVLPLLLVVPALFAAQRASLAERQGDALVLSTQLLVQSLNRGLAEQWRYHEALAEMAGRSGIGVHLSAVLDSALTLNDRLAWVGVAGPDGRIILGSNRLLEGVDVKAEPWFRAGLTGRYARGVDAASPRQPVLSARTSSAPWRVIDYAAPLRGPDGTLLGVLASQVDWLWMQDQVLAAPLPRGIQAMLLTPDGGLLAGPPGLDTAPLRGLVAVASASAPRRAEITWPDGTRYAAVAMMVGGGQPGTYLGWTVVLRQPVEQPAVLQGSHRAVLDALLLAACAVLLLGLLLALYLSRRLGALADAAQAIAEGRLDRPVPAIRTLRELGILSESLARLDRDFPSAVLRDEDGDTARKETPV